MRKLNSFLNLLIFSLVIVIGGAFFYFKSVNDPRQPAKEKGSELSSQELDLIVNKYIKTTNLEALKTKIMAEKFMIEARKKLAEIERQKKIKQDKEISEIPQDRQIRKDNNNDTESPNQIINSKVYENHDQEGMDEFEKKEYARQWILNARKAGYLLELSPELEVIRYTPIRKPSQQDDSADSNPSD